MEIVIAGNTPIEVSRPPMLSRMSAGGGGGTVTANCIFVQSDGSLAYGGTLPADARYVVVSLDAT